MNILQDFIRSDLKLFEGIELTIQALLCASVKISVESVVETLVSRYEQHFDKKRSLKEEQAMHEMEIAENGPSIFRADPLLNVAMKNYWRTNSDSGRWHFIKEGPTFLDHASIYGKATLRLLQEPSRYPIMDD